MTTPTHITTSGGPISAAFIDNTRSDKKEKRSGIRSHKKEKRSGIV